MQRGSEPHPAGRWLVGVLLLIVLAPFGWPAVTHAQTDTTQPYDASADGAQPVGGLGAFERAETSGDRASGLRRSGERSYRRDATELKSRSTGGRFLRTIGWLGLVVALAVGTLHLVRRFLPGSVPVQNRNLVRVIGRGALGPKHQVVVTQVGGQILILGLAGESIVRLGEITDPEEAIRLVPPEESFAGRFAAVEDVYPEESEEWSTPEEEELTDSRLEPYRREVARLQSMVDMWHRQDRLDERGTA